MSAKYTGKVEVIAKHTYLVKELEIDGELTKEAIQEALENEDYQGYEDENLVLMEVEDFILRPSDAGDDEDDEVESEIDSDEEEIDS